MSATLCACAKASESAPDSSSAEASPSDPMQAEQAMKQLEDRLELAARVSFGFHIESQGIVASALDGHVVWERGGLMEIEAVGQFAGEEQVLLLHGDADTLATAIAGEQVWSGVRPDALVQAVAISFTRQGLLHNLAMLTGGQPPERGEGGIETWLGYVKPRLGPTDARAGVEARALEFGIQVEGQDVGDATLWLGAHDLPLERRQTVHFPEGDMQVTERYDDFEIVD